MPNKWTCVICATENEETAGPVNREGVRCDRCRSTWRVRATAVGLLHARQAPLRPLRDLAPNWGSRGIGCSDDPVLAAAFSAQFDYLNTYLHRAPKVDLCEPPAALRGQLDFIVCSDVLEHVPPVPERALAGMVSLLGLAGVAVLSVPMSMQGATREFYPGMVSYSTRPDRSIDWVDHAGNQHHDPNPEYHGGAGRTLAFRLWSRMGIEESLRSVGFTEVVDSPSAHHLGVPELRGHGMLLAFR